jgi:hypothetical protein
MTNNVTGCTITYALTNVAGSPYNTNLISAYTINNFITVYSTDNSLIGLQTLKVTGRQAGSTVKNNYTFELDVRDKCFLTVVTTSPIANGA